MPAAQQGPVISSAPMFPADPTLTAKPVTVRKPGKALTVSGPLKVTGTPEDPRRMILPKVFVDPLFKNVNAPVARVPWIEPVDCTVFDWGGDVVLIIRADTSRIIGFGVLVTPRI